MTTPFDGVVSINGSDLDVGAAKCTGNACSVIAIRWDPNRKGYWIKNSSDREVKVDVNVWLGGLGCSAAWVTYYVDGRDKEFMDYGGHCNYKANYT